VSEPDPDYPLSTFTEAFSSVIGRTLLFVTTCIVAITVGSWLHIGWLNPFHSVIIPWTIIVSFISIWGALFYFALFFVFIRYVRFEGSWIWLPVVFVVQAVDAYLMAGSG
jgi:hypothetical protein